MIGQNAPGAVQVEIQPVQAAHIAALLDFCAELSAFDGSTPFAREQTRASAQSLLDNPQCGRAVWIIVDGQRAGYLMLCFGWSFEFGGRTGVLEHLYVREPFRRQGLENPATPR